MSSLKNFLLEKALRSSARIYLPEINDKRVNEAASELVKLGFNIINHELINDKLDIYKNIISKKKFTFNWSDKMKDEFLSSSLNYGLAALENNDIDFLVAGADHSTSDVLKSAIRIIGVEKKTNWISSSFFMISPNDNFSYTFSDCGVIPEPNSQQLCSIAHEASKLHRLLSDEEPVVAFLSFSSKGSAEHYKCKKVREEHKLFSEKYPNIVSDGEIQFDAAVNKSVSVKKGSSINGQANVFIFPDLDSANIAYKITQYLGGYQALGPLLQGLNKPVHDLSRGCSVDDIIYVSSIAAIQKI